MPETRIYVVLNKQSGLKRLIEATSQSQAIRHCIKPHYEAKVASAKEVAKSGIALEIATDNDEVNEQTAQP